MGLYVFINNNTLKYTRKDGYNPIPFTSEDLKYVNTDSNFKIIDIVNDLGLNVKKNELDSYQTQQEILYSWICRFKDNNINGFNLPIAINKNDEYLTTLKRKFKGFITALDTPAFRHENNLINDVTDICEKIIECYKIASHDSESSLAIMRSIIKRFFDNEFLLCDLGQSYAFRGIAPFSKLHHTGYDIMYQKMMNEPLDFYRIRSGNSVLSKKEDMLHIPYSKSNLVSEQRFSIKGRPCLYLGTSTYDCWMECRNPKLDTVFISGFRPNKKGEKLKILNLAISEYLIDGIYQKELDKCDSMEHHLQNEMIRIFPLVMASSFLVKDDKLNRKKVEYIIPHLIMNSLHACGFDGIAYLSKRANMDIQYPCAVNIALPAYDVCDNQEYSDICNCFTVTPPMKYVELAAKKTNSRNYLSKIYNFMYKDLAFSKYEKMYPNFVNCDNVISDFYR